jgi:1-acyl-sn-glycerol-3-phosphate acyltransferase
MQLIAKASGITITWQKFVSRAFQMLKMSRAKPHKLMINGLRVTFKES